VNKTSGELAVGPNLAAIREFTAPIRVWIKDGLNKAEATLTIEVKMVTDEALENAIVLTVVRQNLEQFLQGTESLRICTLRIFIASILHI